jgi:hypothetical protein
LEEGLKRKAEERVTGKDCDRFAELHMTRRPPTTQFIIVNRGKVVMN